jgi:uncharacterized SAM-binding protein YcdF (DUF218 family)
LAALTPETAGRVIAVFGCRVGDDGVPSPALERRLVRALLEAQRQPQALLLVSGGTVHGQVEARAMHRWLVEAGIAATRILVEPEARDTEENAAFTARLLAGRELGEVLLVTDRFHMRRSRLLLALALRRCLSHPVTVAPAPAADDKPHGEALALWLGELWKIGSSLWQVLWRRYLRA